MLAEVWAPGHILTSVCPLLTPLICLRADVWGANDDHRPAGRGGDQSAGGVGGTPGAGAINGGKAGGPGIGGAGGTAASETEDTCGGGG